MSINHIIYNCQIYNEKKNMASNCGWGNSSLFLKYQKGFFLENNNKEWMIAWRRIDKYSSGKWVFVVEICSVVWGESLCGGSCTLLSIHGDGDIISVVDLGIRLTIAYFPFVLWKWLKGFIFFDFVFSFFSMKLHLHFHQHQPWVCGPCYDERCLSSQLLPVQLVNDEPKYLI